MRQEYLAPAAGSKRKRKRVGRGLGSGHGRYATRGLKGQNSRSGGGVPLYFEGGQLPLTKRLPTRRGFTNIFKTEYSTVNVGRLNVFEAGSAVDKVLLLGAGLIKSSRKPVKILGAGELSHGLTVIADRFSTVARMKIEAAGGIAEESTGATETS